MKINIGCGNDIRPDFVNLDVANLKGVNIVHDVNTLPLPFKKEAADYILCLDLLEHINYVDFLKDVNRILKKGGEVEIRVPHFTSRFNFIDPTHIIKYSIQTFEFFLENSFFKREYYTDFSFDTIIKRKILFEKSIVFPWNYFVEKLVNLSLSTQIYFEATFLSRIFPASNINVVLRKSKT